MNTEEIVTAFLKEKLEIIELRIRWNVEGPDMLEELSQKAEAIKTVLELVG